MTLVCYNPELDELEEWDSGWVDTITNQSVWKVTVEISDFRTLGFFSRIAPQDYGRIVLGEL